MDNEEIEEPQEMHPAVQLLLARMDSHPDEFVGRGLHRWESVYSDINHVASPHEKKAMKAKLREIKMGRIHKEIMGLLLRDAPNEPEEAQDAGVTLARQHLQQQQDYQRISAQLAQMQVDAQARALQQFQNTFPRSTDLWNSSSIGTTMPSRYPTPTDMEKNGIMGALRGLLK
jgi:hypothetical protein